MCGSILDRRRIAPAGANVVPMPTRSEEAPPPAFEPPAPPAEHDESKPPRLADEHFSAPAAPIYARDEGSFSIFGVDTGGPMHTNDVPQGLNGPSFLGLGDSDGSGDYLLEDEESHAGRKFLLVVALLVVGGLAYLQYRADAPVTSIWAAIKSRATGQPAQTSQPQDPAASGVQPTQPTSTKPDANAQPDAAASAPVASANPQTQNPPPADEANAAPAAGIPSDKSAAKDVEQKPPASASKTQDIAPAEKPAARKKTSGELMAKAQHPESDQDTAAQNEEEAPAKPSRGKPSAAMEARGDRQDDALVTRAQGYLYGKGGARSCNTALSLLKQAAGRGNAKADSQLGAMYATGNCAPFDRAEAYRWFTKAAEADPANSYLQRSRDMMWREMSPQERRKVLE
jgi:hypothetical protein